jgi:hypothetical protein
MSVGVLAVVVATFAAFGGVGETRNIAHAAAGGWSSVADMTTPRQNQTATLLADGRVLVAGGLNGGLGNLSSAELFDPASSTWAPTGSMSVGRNNFTATLLADGRVLVTGGGPGNNACSKGSGGSVATLTPSELYDPTSGVWTSTGTESVPRWFHTATRLVDGRVLVVGGVTTSAELATAELYDPGTGMWSVTGSMTTARSRHTAVLLGDGRVLVQGGFGTSAPEIYDPSSGNWSVGSAPPGQVFGGTLVLLGDGSALTAGGNDASLTGLNFTGTSARYQPMSDGWSSTGSLKVARSDHVASVLGDGTVLVTGGCGLPPDPTTQPALPLSSAEIYVAGTGTWSLAGSMATARLHFTSTLLSDGRVLVAGGNNGTDGISLASAETFRGPSPLAATVTGITPNGGSGAGGTPVMITGTNFTAATAVKFGSAAAASFSVSNATQITATSPPGSSTVDVTVTTAGGTSATTSADRFTYVAFPTVGSVFPNIGENAGGTSVTITGTNLTAATAVKFGISAATTYSINSATQISATSPPGSGIVNVTVTTAAGKSAIGPADQFTYVARVPSNQSTAAPLPDRPPASQSSPPTALEARLAQLNSGGSPAAAASQASVLTPQSTSDDVPVTAEWETILRRIVEALPVLRWLLL